VRSLAVLGAGRTRWCGLMQAARAAPAAPRRCCWVPSLKAHCRCVLVVTPSAKEWEQTEADGPRPLIQRGCRPLAQVAHRPAPLRPTLAARPSGGSRERTGPAPPYPKEPPCAREMHPQRTRVPPTVTPPHVVVPPLFPRVPRFTHQAESRPWQLCAIPDSAWAAVVVVQGEGLKSGHRRRRHRVRRHPVYVYQAARERMLRLTPSRALCVCRRNGDRACTLSVWLAG